MLDTGFLGWVGEGGAGSCHVSTFLAMKASPFLSYCSCSSGVSFFRSLTMLMSMVLKSLAILGDKEKYWKVWVDLLFHWAICSVQSHWFWKWAAFEYQLSILSEMVSRGMILFMSGVVIPVAKKLIRTLWSIMLA